MKLFTLLVGFFFSVSVLAQTVPNSTEKMPVDERMAKARAAKADKKINKIASQEAPFPTPTLRKPPTRPNQPAGSLKTQKAIPADYTTPVITSLKGPNGEIIHTGEHGGKYYINKNGNKTYLSSNL